MPGRHSLVKAGISAFAAAVACAALAPAAATAGVVSCPSGETYEMTQGDPPLSFQGTCTGVGTITYSLVTGVGHGSLVGTPAGDATYTPNVNFSGTDSFTYRATDSEGDFADRTITITVHPGPASGLPPSCPDPVRVFVPEGGSLILTGNCSDPDAEVGEVIVYGLASFPANGGLTIVNGNQVQYTPPAGVTSDSFRYTAMDADGNTVEAEVLLTVTPAGTTEVATAPEATSSTPYIAGIETSTTVPVTIGPRPVSSPPPVGYFFLGTEFNIEAPAQTAADPLRLTFTIDRTALPLSGSVIAFRDGDPVDDPCDGSGQANPDPCVASSGLIDPDDPDSDYRIVILTSHASGWNTGYAAQPANKDACKAGGWKSFPGFKNQGDCVSSVATRGR